jgi:hypothetical protein
MKIKISLLLGLFSLYATHAQTDGPATETETTGTVEKSIFSVQTGAVGFWVSNELGLSNSIALRTEVGLDLWYYDSFWTDESGAILAPSISVEPRWYYNIAKRAGKGRRTENNSANFVTLAVEFYPDLFLIGDAPSYVHIPNQISFIPKWGIRRNIGSSNFNYEAGIGIGYLLMLDNDNYIMSSTDNVGLDLHLRIGYTF